MSKQPSKPKAHKLPDSTRRQVARAYLDGVEANDPAITYESVARRFHCTVEQVRHAVRLFQDGKLMLRRGVSRSKVRIVDDLPDDIDEVIEKEVRQIVHDLSSDPNLTAAERIPLIQKLMSARKRMQEISLVGHLRKINADFMIGLVRRFLPEATEEDVVQIIREEAARCER